MQHQQPNARPLPVMSINELMGATLRLSDIMGEETAMLSEMRYQELPSLHEEKTKLTKLLESYQQVMARDPGFIKNADEKTREELLLITDDLAVSVEENFRKVAVAKAVNSRVMQAIMDVMGEQYQPMAYGPQGMPTSTADLSLSMNLNQQA